MKALVGDLASGNLKTLDIPQPELRPGGILVRTAFSAISSGTERAKIEISEKSLISKAAARPDLVKDVLNYARANGVLAAYEKVQTKLTTLAVMGYSCAGTVIAVAPDVTEFQPGDRVACGGAGYAGHSEVNWIPRNLAVRVPENVSLDAAALTTIGAVAMQGLRQSRAAVGETVLIVGAGLLGILTIQLARAAGCRVIAVDIDSARVENALTFGAHLALLTSHPLLESATQTFSRYGPDVAIITAASRTAEPVETAARLLRDRGRIVLVGDVGMGVSRAHVYEKELSIVMSRSYGPGRYDPAYEEQGRDYPIGYVRWTERRNMEAFLDLLSSGAVVVNRLITQRRSIAVGAQAYEDLTQTGAYTFILEYGDETEVPKSAGKTSEARYQPARAGQIRIGCIGAGNFAQSQLFPFLKRASDVSLEAIASASGVTAESARLRFGFRRALTPSELLRDSDLDGVFIASRNDSHAQYVVDALRAGKAVFVEKPLVVDRAQLGLVKKTCAELTSDGMQPFLMVGFNRRFAPLSARIKEFFSGRREPMMVHLRVNAGYLPAEHWTQQDEQGGRIIGEFCHFVDLARYLTGSPIRSVSASLLPDNHRYHGDNLACTITFADGSIANVLYLANGDSVVPKEYLEVFCEGSVSRMEDFSRLELSRNHKTKQYKSPRDKGHQNELEQVLKAMASGGPAPIPLDELFEVTEATFLVAEAGASANSLETSAALPAKSFVGA
jgi:predicted dehydrogenase/threonine dehydrogenase-like Zn-dependent dehydrogenase